MGSQSGGANSTRLSLDIADLPLTPFGMSPKHPTRKHTLFSQRTNKLSLKSRKEREDKEYSLERERRNGKENMNPKNHQHQSSRYAVLETVSEEISSPAATTLETNDYQATLQSSGISEDVNIHQVQVEVYLKERNNVTLSEDVNEHGVQGHVHKEDSVMPVNMPHLPRRQSTYTDIDEGSFIEFCQGNEDGRTVPTQKERCVTPQLYYTCESQNDTQFSTSTKTKNCLVGFRKFLDTFKRQKDLRNITEESEVELPQEMPKRIINFNCDETIITCSADVAKRIMYNKEKKQQQAVINSTVIHKLPCEASVPFPNVFPDISTLAMPSETVSSSGSGNNSPITPLHRRQKAYACNNDQLVITVSESSNDSENYTLQKTTEVLRPATQGGRNIYVQKHGYSQNIPSPSSAQPSARAVNMSLLSDDASSNDEVDDTLEQVAKVGTNIYIQKHREQNQNSPIGESVDVPGQSLISEDVSIVSSILPISSNGNPRQHAEVGKSLSRPWNPSGQCDDSRKSPNHHQSPGKSSSQSWNPSGNCVGNGKSPSHHDEIGKSLVVKCDDGGKPVYVEIDDDSQIVYDYDGEDEADIPEPQEQRPATPENTKNPATARWIMTSPFHESSFGTSFMENFDNSNHNESLNQAKPTSSVNKSQDSSDKHLEPRFSHQHVQERLKQRSSCVRQGTKNISVVASSSSDESEEDLRLKRSFKDCRIIQSSSSDSDVEATVQHHVSRRRKLSFEKRRGGMLPRQNQVVESSDSSSPPPPEESLHLRLSESHSRVSEKTIKTIGRIAKSPGNTVKSSVLSPCNREKNSVLSLCNTKKTPVIVPSSDESFEVQHRRPPAHVRRISSSDFDQSEEEPVNLSKNSDSLPDVNIDNVSQGGKWSRNTTKFLYPPSVQKQSGGSTQNKGSNTNIRLREVQNELDNINSIDLKKYQTKGSNIASKNRNKITIKEERALKREKGIIQKKLQIQSSDSEDEREDNFIYQVEETIDVSSDETLSDESVEEDESYESKKKKVKNPISTGEMKNRLSSDDGNNDSFEKYLTRVKRQIEEEKEKRKKYVTTTNLNEYESSFIDDGNSEDEEVSYRLPPPLTPSHTPHPPTARLHELGSITDDPIGKTPKNKTGRHGTTSTVNTPASDWRDLPSVSLDSDSDAEVFPGTQTKKKKAPPKHKPFITPQKPFKTPKAVIPPPKPFPKTEGHKRTTKQYSSGVNFGTPTLTFLTSLSSTVNLIRCHPDALIYTKNFKRKKGELAEKLHKYYNSHVFNNQLPAELNIKWNNRMTKTAGFCYYQIDRSKPCGRNARIELATKVIDSPERLRDTLIHELCHAASWIISGYKAGHGPLWKAWASRAKQTFPDLPPITRCHSYAIQCRYTYRCTRCSYSIGRHSKSLDTNKKVCGHCYGRFELLDNNQRTPSASGANSTSSAGGTDTPAMPPRTPKTPGPFALFVKENYGTVKQSGGGLKHADVMKALSAKFSKMKATGTS
ncbi:hypothetical protein Pmani_018062 [Petrolisthes manimaculis]|uniref:SprT-like domain-containing protein n=1 Tax=Petrolisthes manimaculis TaxID=1843537 RepID=A0AAE1U963_9EUCA|nr:hypothetical protein Pmani_018062 [Petrolisthes manimaculis]